MKDLSREFIKILAWRREEVEPVEGVAEDEEEREDEAAGAIDPTDAVDALLIGIARVPQPREQVPVGVAAL